MHHETVGIIGLGLMGQSIGAGCLRAGLRLVVVDSDATRMTAFLDSHEAFAGRIIAATTLDELAACDLIIEAVIEHLDAKLDLLKRLDHAAPDATVASNSSTFMPSELAQGLTDPSRLLVCHFFNPADTVPLVEIVPSPRSDPARVEQVRAFSLAIGKHPVLLRREIEGFVANRLQAAILRECYALVEHGIASPQTVDEVVKLSLAPRWAANGPIATADLGGLDVFLALCERLLPRLDRSTSAQRTLRQHVGARELGAKTGAGVYEWTAERRSDAEHRLSEYFRFGSLLESGETWATASPGASAVLKPTEYPGQNR